MAIRNPSFKTVTQQEIINNAVTVQLSAEAITTIKTTSDNADYFIGIDAASQLYKITKADLLAGLSSGSGTGGNGSNTAWTPALIATLLWLDASDSNTITTDSNNLISSWADKAGSGRGVYQANNSNKPLLITDLNNKKVAVFDGTNDYLRDGTVYNYGNTVSMFFVAKFNDSARTSLFDTAPNQQNVLRNIPNAFEWWNNDPVLSINCSIGSYEILNFNYAVTPNRVISKYINGGNYAIANSGNSTGANWTTLTIGAINTTDLLLNGNIAEIIFCGSIPTEGIRQKIEGYLAHKWALTANLDANHPYKSSAPTV
jgi:hypothetical protein